MKSIFSNTKVIKLLFLSVIGVLSGSLAVPIEIHFIRRITGDNSLASYAFTVATIASVLGVLVLAKLANNIGRKKIIYWAYFFNILLPLYYSTIFSILQLYGVKFIWSFIIAGAGTLVGAFIQQEVASFQHMSGRFYGIMYAIQSGVGSLGVLIGGIVSDKFGITSVYYAVAAASLIQFLIIVSIVKEGHEPDKEEHKESGSIIEGIKFIWQNSQLRARFIMITSFGINWSTKAILYPIIILSVTGANTNTGIVMGTQGIVAMIALPFIGKIIDKRGYAGVLIIGYIILGCAIITFSLSSYMPLIWLASAFVAIGEASNGPAMSTLEVKNIPDRLRNSVVAIHNAYSTIVEVVSTFAIGLFLKFAQPQSIMFYSGIAVLAALVIAQMTSRLQFKNLKDA